MAASTLKHTFVHCVFTRGNTGWITNLKNFCPGEYILNVPERLLQVIMKVNLRTCLASFDLTPILQKVDDIMLSHAQQLSWHRDSQPVSANLKLSQPPGVGCVWTARPVISQWIEFNPERIWSGSGQTALLALSHTLCPTLCFHHTFIPCNVYCLIISLVFSC